MKVVFPVHFICNIAVGLFEVRVNTLSPLISHEAQTNSPLLQHFRQYSCGWKMLPVEWFLSVNLAFSPISSTSSCNFGHIDCGNWEDYQKLPIDVLLTVDENRCAISRTESHNSWMFSGCTIGITEFFNFNVGFNYYLESTVHMIFESLSPHIKRWQALIQSLHKWTILFCKHVHALYIKKLFSHVMDQFVSCVPLLLQLYIETL